MIDLYFLIPAVIAQIFNPTAELVIPKGTPTTESNAEIETQPFLFHLKYNFLFYLFFLSKIKAYVFFCHICH